MNLILLRNVIFSFIFTVLIYLLFVNLVCNGKGFIDFYCSDIKEFNKFYAEHLRGHLFAGFLALGGFLLSLKTFIVVTMKEKVYDNKEYRKGVVLAKKRKTEITVYGPLKELSDYLFYSIIVSIFAAVLQLTLGLFEHTFTTVLCLYFCILATSLLTHSLMLIKNNLDTWFSYLEAEEPK
ncbi:hypothetical protein AAEU29_10995 [Pseudoalteromonas sp. SSM20]|uniref:hypothetical protein n=1 Tax=Pseudoalteromonas sp. SSM20 TaxID=3139394 RepID=UPI003BAA9924